MAFSSKCEQCRVTIWVKRINADLLLKTLTVFFLKFEGIGIGTRNFGFWKLWQYMLLDRTSNINMREVWIMLIRHGCTCLHYGSFIDSSLLERFLWAGITRRRWSGIHNMVWYWQRRRHHLLFWWRPGEQLLILSTQNTLHNSTETLTHIHYCVCKSCIYQKSTVDRALLMQTIGEWVVT